MPGRGITSKLTQICVAWAVVSVSMRAATSQPTADVEVDPDSEVDVFLPALAKKLAKRATTRKFRLVTTSSSVAEADVVTGHDPNKAGQLAIINFRGNGQRRRQQQQQQRRRNRNNNNNNNNNFNNNNILNSNPLMMNGTYGVANSNPLAVANVNTLQRRNNNNQKRRQQKVGVFVAGGQNRRRPMQILRPARVNRRRQNNARRRNNNNNNNRRQNNNRNNNNNLGVFGGQYLSPASKLPVAYPEPMPAYPNNNMYPNPAVALNPQMNPANNFNANPPSNNNYNPPATNFNPFAAAAGGVPGVVYQVSNNAPSPPLPPANPQQPNPNAEVFPLQMQPEASPPPPPQALPQVVDASVGDQPVPTVLVNSETPNPMREY